MEVSYRWRYLSFQDGAGLHGGGASCDVLVVEVQPRLEVLRVQASPPQAPRTLHLQGQEADRLRGRSGVAASPTQFNR